MFETELLKNILINLLKGAVLILGFMDAYKYKLLAQKVSRLKASGQISRAFLVWSILNRLVLLIYVWLFLNDKILITTSLIALYTMFEAFYYTYIYYPYRLRGLKNFKRPSIFIFTKDIFFPNKHGKRL